MPALPKGAVARLKELNLRPPPREGPAILFYDIETAPSLCWMWSQWNSNVVDTEQDWYLLSFAYKWFTRTPVKFVSIFQDPEFVPDTDNDLYVVERLHALHDAADVVVAHNGDRFDQRKAAARYLVHGLYPPSPFQSIDTLKESRRYFNMYSHALKELGRYSSLGTKVAHHGFDLWRGCMAGDPKSWRLMEKYNRQDVKLLEALYLHLRAWIGSPGRAGHPNMGHWVNIVDPENPVCPTCGKQSLHKRGFHRTSFTEWQTWWCNPKRDGCGSYSRSRRSVGQPTGGVKAV